MRTNPRSAQRTAALIQRLNNPRVSVVDERKRLVVKYIREHGSVDRFDLYELFDTDTVSTIDLPLDHLSAEGAIYYVRGAGGGYRLTPHGESMYRG